MAANFPPPPTYAEPTITDPQTKKASFNPIWLKWFLDVAQGLENATAFFAHGVNHEGLAGLQGGSPPAQFYHLSLAQFNALWPSPITTAGDLIIGNVGGAPSRLPIGLNGQTLTIVSGVPTWV